MAQIIIDTFILQLRKRYIESNENSVLKHTILIIIAIIILAFVTVAMITA